MGPCLLGERKYYTCIIFCQNLRPFDLRIVELCLKTCLVGYPVSAGLPVTYVNGVLQFVFIIRTLALCPSFSPFLFQVLFSCSISVPVLPPSLSNSTIGSLCCGSLGMSSSRDSTCHSSARGSARDISALRSSDFSHSCLMGITMVVSSTQVDTSNSLLPRGRFRLAGNALADGDTGDRANGGENGDGNAFLRYTVSGDMMSLSNLVSNLIPRMPGNSSSLSLS